MRIIAVVVGTLISERLEYLRRNRLRIGRLKKGQLKHVATIQARFVCMPKSAVSMGLGQICLSYSVRTGLYVSGQLSFVTDHR